MAIEIIIGIVLIVASVPVGWGGALLFGYYGKKNGKNFFYILSGIIYALSWGMFILGTYLCGKPYAEYIVKNYIYKYIVHTIVVCICIVLMLIFVYRKKFFKKYKKDKN